MMSKFQSHPLSHIDLTTHLANKYLGMSYAALCEEERRLRDGLRVTEQRQSKKLRDLEDRIKER